MPTLRALAALVCIALLCGCASNSDRDNTIHAPPPQLTVVPISVSCLPLSEMIEVTMTVRNDSPNTVTLVRHGFEPAIMTAKVYDERGTPLVPGGKRIREPGGANWGQIATVTVGPCETVTITEPVFPETRLSKLRGPGLLRIEAAVDVLRGGEEDTMLCVGEGTVVFE
jgi:hypothetical protein